MSKKTFPLVLKIFIAAIVSCIFAIYIYWVDACGPVTTYDHEHIERVEVPSGMTIRQVAALLKQDKLIHSELVFYLAARYPFLDKSQMNGLQEGTFELKSGVYEVSSAMGLSEIFSLLSSGKQEYIKISIPEGLTLNKIAKKLDEEGVCKEESFIKEAHSKELLAEYNIPSDSFEGYLFPDTYFFTPSMTGESTIRFFADNFFSKIENIQKFQNYSAEQLFEAVTLASIVEREYRVADEAPLIASVFKNRLEKNIGLYSCATIEYILTEIQGRQHPDVITYEDLSIDSPYNTYKWAGLPPAPISNPGMTALSAVADTPKTNYFFFRLTDSEKGRHSFSSDFKTHIAEGQQLYTKTASGK